MGATFATFAGVERRHPGDGGEGQGDPAAAAALAVPELDAVVATIHGHRQEPLAGVVIHYQFLQGVGVVDYLEVLDSERTRFSAELDQSQALQRYLNAVVELYKALGGGWSAQAQATDNTNDITPPENQPVDEEEEVRKPVVGDSRPGNSETLPSGDIPAS